jgi:hypothetical protein
MAGTITHLAIADKLYDILGCSKIKNYPLFLGGNIAPDAAHAKKNYQRLDKKHTHLTNGINAYGYGQPEAAKLFRTRINDFIEKYYFPATENKDLYLGYIVHLLTDEFYLLSVYKQLEDIFIFNGANPNEPDFQKNLFDEVITRWYEPNRPIGSVGIDYKKFFEEDVRICDFSMTHYTFKHNTVVALKAVWDYEITDYLSANELNISKRWVINTLFKNGNTYCENITADDCRKYINLLDKATAFIITCLSGKMNITKIM